MTPSHLQWTKKNLAVNQTMRTINTFSDLGEGKTDILFLWGPLSTCAHKP